MSSSFSFVKPILKEKLKIVYPMEAGASIDSLDPKRAHIPLLVSAISVWILQRLLDPLSSDPDAILGAPPETFGELKDLIFVHPRISFFSLFPPPISPILCHYMIQELRLRGLEFRWIGCGWSCETNEHPLSYLTDYN